MYDLLVIGGGPAGLSAALNARRRNKRVLLAAKETISSKLRPAGRIENYPGLPGVSGPELAERFREHAVATGVEIRKEDVLNLQRGKDGFFVMGKNESYEATAVILATGAPQKASLPGEAELAGRGVSYCATCDGMFFRDRDVMVISQLPAGEEEAAFWPVSAGKSITCRNIRGVQPAARGGTGKRKGPAFGGRRTTGTGGYYRRRI